MKITHVKIGRRTFALAFTMDAMAVIQDRIDNFNLHELTNYVKSPRSLVDILDALAQQGELLEGRTIDVDRAWFGSHMSPSPLNVNKLHMAVLNALSDGLAMNAEAEDEDNGEVDVVLEELRKKEKPAD